MSNTRRDEMDNYLDTIAQAHADLQLTDGSAAAIAAYDATVAAALATMRATMIERAVWRAYFTCEAR